MPEGWEEVQITESQGKQLMSILNDPNHPTGKGKEMPNVAVPSSQKKARLTVVEQVVYQINGQQPDPFEARSFRELTTDEQPYQRRFTVGTEWTPLECGWVQSCSMMLLHNHAGEGRRTKPTEQEKVDAARQVIEVCYLGCTNHTWLTHPGETTRCCPASVRKLLIRCRHGETRVTLTLIPE